MLTDRMFDIVPFENESFGGGTFTQETDDLKGFSEDLKEYVLARQPAQWGFRVNPEYSKEISFDTQKVRHLCYARVFWSKETGDPKEVSVIRIEDAWRLNGS